MISFEDHAVMLAHINTRTEQHGDSEVLALDLKITCDLPAGSLDDLSPSLCEALYDDTDGMPHLRNPELGLLYWAGKWSPVAFRFHDGIDEDDLQFTIATLDKVAFTPKEGGTVSWVFRLQVWPEDSDVTARIVDLLHRPDTRATLQVSDDALEREEGDETLPLFKAS